MVLINPEDLAQVAFVGFFTFRDSVDPCITCVSEEGEDGKSTASEELSLMSYKLRYVSLTD